MIILFNVKDVARGFIGNEKTKYIVTSVLAITNNLLKP